MAAAVHPSDDITSSNAPWTCNVESASLSLLGTTKTLLIVLSEPLPAHANWNSPIIISNHARYAGVWMPKRISADRRTVNCALPAKAEEATADSKEPIYEWSVRVLESSRIVVCKNVYDVTSDTTVCMAPPLVLKLRCNIFSINKVDTVEQTFVADVFFECRLGSISEVDNQAHVEEMLAVYGLTKDMFAMLNTDIALEDWRTFGMGDTMKAYDYTFKFRGKGEFAEEYELENFPFDEQFLNLTVSVLRPGDLVRLESNEQYPSTFVSSNFQMSNIFRVVYQDLVLVKRSFSNARESASGMVYPRMTFSVLFLRKPMYYVTNIVLPMLLLTYLSFLSFAVSFDGSRLDTNDRLGITLTLLLTAVAYKFVVASAIPQVSYLTLLDQHISFCFAFLCVIIGENALYPFLVTRTALKVAEEDEIYVFYALLGLLTAVMIVWLLRILWWMVRRESYYSKKMLAEQVNRLVAQTFKSECDSQRHKLTTLILQRNGVDLQRHHSLIYFADPAYITSPQIAAPMDKMLKAINADNITDQELLHMDLNSVFGSPDLLERLMVLLQKKVVAISTVCAEQQVTQPRSKRTRTK